ncbi:MAG: acetylglutamate kinase [Candidatus Altiarchaeales archaeon]|nr:acetylglutamate kinase [Candidatus Altiarchaeales archaeon]MBD3416588.1 acetylglutamate kinase [Candidatus Altiarchaeales archaeon]
MRKSEILVEAIEYIRKFSGDAFVIKFGGETLLDKDVVDSVAKDLILLNALGIRTVVVHGGGVEISEAMEKFGKKPAFVKGLRVTDRETMDIVEMVLSGKVNQQLVGVIHKHGGEVIGLSGKSGCLFEAVKQKKKKVDLGQVGEIRNVNPKIVKTQLDSGYIPIISPIGLTREGDTLNINADTAAAELAASLKAKKLIILTNVEGVLDKKRKLVHRLTVTEANRLIRDDVIVGGMIPKIKACTHALKNGVERTHIIKASKHAILEEILTVTGTGTMITRHKVKGG